MKANLETVPAKINKSALVYECNRLHASYHVVLPESGPVLVAVRAFTFRCWNAIHRRAMRQSPETTARAVRLPIGGVDRAADPSAVVQEILSAAPKESLGLIRGRAPTHQALSEPITKPEQSRHGPRPASPGARPSTRWSRLRAARVSVLQPENDQLRGAPRSTRCPSSPRAQSAHEPCSCRGRAHRRCRIAPSSGAPLSRLPRRAGRPPWVASSRPMA